MQLRQALKTGLKTLVESGVPSPQLAAELLLMHVLGRDRGYLYAYPLAAFISGWFSERGWGASMQRAFIAMLVALAVIYAGGWSWLAILSGPRAAFSMAVVPFVIADIMKIVIGAAILPYAQRWSTGFSR